MRLACHPSRLYTGSGLCGRCGRAEACGADVCMCGCRESTVHTPMRCTHNKLIFWSTSNVCLLPKFPRKSHPHTTSPAPLPSFRPHVSPVSSLSPGSSLPCLHCTVAVSAPIIVSSSSSPSSRSFPPEPTRKTRHSHRHRQRSSWLIYGLFHALKSLVDPPSSPPPYPFFTKIHPSVLHTSTSQNVVAKGLHFLNINSKSPPKPRPATLARRPVHH